MPVVPVTLSLNGGICSVAGVALLMLVWALANRDTNISVKCASDDDDDDDPEITNISVHCHYHVIHPTNNALIWVMTCAVFLSL